MDVFSLFAKIGLDTSKYDKGLDDASGKTHRFGEAIKTGLATAAKVGAAGLTVATAAIGALSKVALDSYGDYEQLTGGVETLFKTSADVVMGYANNAYQTAGLSANQYMETVTSFSASLLQSLGGDTEAAAQYADMAITDMADNANKMGTDMEMIQNAYSGFAKQNFTMLDNLKLGYGGTKEEMERLLADAEKLSGQKFDISSYADIVDAIHIVQTEMGITGTTAKEAASTIQGSVSAAKSAWENLVAGIGNENADLDVLITNFVDSVGTAGENIIPRVEQILVGMGAAIQKLAPIIGEQLPPLIQSVLPSLLSAGGELISGLANGIITAAPALIETGVPVVASLVSGLTSALPQIAESAVTIILKLVDGISAQLPELIPVAVDAILQLAETLTGPGNLGILIDSGLDLIMSLADGLINALPALIEKVPIIIENLITALAENGPKILVAGVELVLKLAAGVVSAIPKFVGKVPELIGAYIAGITEWFGNLVSLGGDLVNKIGEGISNLAGDALQWGKDLISNFVQGIKNAIGKVKDAVSGIANTVREFLGFSEPEKGPLSNFHTYAPDMMQLFAKGITDNAGLLKSAFDKSLDFGSAAIDFSASYTGSSYIGNVSAPREQNAPQNSGTNVPPITIVVQSVLDGKVIGETSYNYIHNRERAYGGAY